MNTKFIVIGDIHGCLEQLDEILEQTEKFIDHRFIFLGDYIDRGPDSEGVINRIKKLDAVFLLGNHEEMLLERKTNMKGEYFEDLLMRTKLSISSIQWLEESTIKKYETEEYIFVHAGLDKNKSINEQTKRDYLWTREDSDYLSITSKTVIHGHTIVENPVIMNNRININTGCGSKGYLSALILPEMVFIRSSKSPGIEHDWQRIKEELEEELKLYDSFGVLEEITEDEQ